MEVIISLSAIVVFATMCMVFAGWFGNHRYYLKRNKVLDYHQEICFKLFGKMCDTETFNKYDMPKVVFEIIIALLIGSFIISQFKNLTAYSKMYPEVCVFWFIFSTASSSWLLSCLAGWIYFRHAKKKKGELHRKKI